MRSTITKSYCEICNEEGRCEPDPECDEPYYWIEGYFTYYEETFGRPGCDSQTPCDTACITENVKVYTISGNLDDENDFGPDIIWEEGQTFGSSNTVCDFLECPPGTLGCVNGGEYTTFIPYRSDGVTPAGGADPTARERFSGIYSNRPQFSCITRTTVSGPYTDYIGYGNTPEEAYENCQAKKPDFGQPQPGDLCV